MTDIVLMTSELQVFLEPSRVNFLLLPSQVKKLIGRLNGNCFNPSAPEDCFFFFAKLNELVTATNKKIKVVEISGHTKISIRGDLLIPFAVHFWMT